MAEKKFQAIVYEKGIEKTLYNAFKRLAEANGQSVIGRLRLLVLNDVKANAAFLKL